MYISYTVTAIALSYIGLGLCIELVRSDVYHFSKPLQVSCADASVQY